MDYTEYNNLWDKLVEEGFNSQKIQVLDDFIRYIIKEEKNEEGKS